MLSQPGKFCSDITETFQCVFSHNGGRSETTSINSVTLIAASKSNHYNSSIRVTRCKPDEHKTTTVSSRPTYCNSRKIKLMTSINTASDDKLKSTFWRYLCCLRGKQRNTRRLHVGEMCVHIVGDEKPAAGECLYTWKYLGWKLTCKLCHCHCAE